ncbi:jg4536 [Pararge aegeria aegeria]|uniref:Jg4536 protein n=1 Tax=Pararge aegeria aegeria TaxID=348720 RepID=A0A8S4RPX3_9NEOP|nr:jg4536 [Pararge aegeria aegeria]
MLWTSSSAYLSSLLDLFICTPSRSIAGLLHPVLRYCLNDIIPPADASVSSARLSIQNHSAPPPVLLSTYVARPVPFQGRWSLNDVSDSS